MKNVKEITKEIKNEEWTNYLKDAFNKKKKDIKIDGFRKGSVTWDLFIKKVGIETLYPDAADIAIEKEYEGAFKEADVIPVIQPTVDITKLDKDGITIVYKFISKPEVKLGDYTNWGIKKETAKVTKKDVEEEIANTYNIPKDELLNQIGGMDMIKFDLKMKKALEFLKNN